MRNTDAWILGVGVVMFFIGYITAVIILNSRMRKLQDENHSIKSKSNEHYQSGWSDGWDSLAANDDAMRKELARMDNMRRVPRHKEN